MKKELKVHTIILSAAITSGIIILIALLCCMYLIQETKTLVQLENQKQEATALARQLSDTSDYLTEKIRAYAATGNKQYYDDYWTEVNTTKRREAAIEGLEILQITDSEMQYITNMKAASDNLIPLEEEAMDMVGNGNLTGAINAVYGDQYMQGKNIVDNNGNSFKTDLEHRYETILQGQQTNTVRQAVIIDVMLGLVLLVSIVNTAIIRRKVTLPVGKLAESFRHLSEGKLNEHIPLEETTSEIGILTGALKRTQQMLQAYIADITENLSKLSKGDMTTTVTQNYIGDFQAIQESINSISRSMNETLSQIRISSSEVSTGADQVSAGAQALSQGATEQASAVEQLAATINEISDHVQQNAGNAARANQMSEQSAAVVERGNRQMRDLTEAIGKINEASSQIGSIIKTIEDIAFQTNMLALNAAVEAARAGTAGKGFAVVADEVRSLANRSAEAAKNTTQLIEESIQAVENGMHIAEDTANSLADIVEDTRQSSALISEIAEASARQAESIQQVTLGIDQISSVVQTNSATAEQSAAASEELNGQAQMLENLVQRFHLRNAGIEF